MSDLNITAIDHTCDETGAKGMTRPGPDIIWTASQRENRMRAAEAKLDRVARLADRLAKIPEHRDMAERIRHAIAGEDHWA